ncbi:MAG: 1,2-phenylacetyl-CoA epoxidase subunit PaaD [bacterium]
MLTTATDLETRIWDALGTVQDPELPISVTDLGMVDRVDVLEGRVRITMVPTYSACPAIDVMRQDIGDSVKRIPGVIDVRVDLSFERPWTMDRMTERGRQRLREHGVSVGAAVNCPFCGSANTTLENPFGPTLCRAIYYCNDCHNPIERFKPPRDD